MIVTILDKINHFFTSDVFSNNQFGILVAIATATVTWILWHTYGKIKINCWFCNTDSIVLFKLRNQWTCDRCHQYNGFTSSGDYNDLMPELERRKMTFGHLNEINYGKQCHTQTRSAMELCKRCNRNQALKVKQLSQFEPMCEANFDSEVEEYKQKLDRLYRLCRTCQSTVGSHIKRQDTQIKQNMPERKLLKNGIIKGNESIKLNPSQFTQTKMEIFVNGSKFSCLLVAFMLYYAVVIANILQNILSDAFTGGIFQFTNSEPTGCLLLCGLFLTAAGHRYKGTLWSRFAFLFWLLHFLFYFLYCKDAFIFAGWCKAMQSVTEICDSLMQRLGLKFTAYVEKLLMHQQVLVFFQAFSFCLIQAILFLVTFISAFSKKQPVIKKANDIGTKLPSSRASIYDKRLNNKIPLNTINSEFFSDEDSTSEEDMSGLNLNTLENKSSSLPSRKQQQAVHSNKPFKSNLESNLNGSLLSLHLNDEKENPFSSLNCFKSPGSIISHNTAANTVLSAFHTPPPSRSSSLLSLASHTSSNFAKQVNNVEEKFNLPFQHYRSNNTLIEDINKPFVSSKSTASFPLLNKRKPSHLVSRAFSTTNRLQTRPLISPAKFKSSANHRPSSFATPKHVHQQYDHQHSLNKDCSMHSVASSEHSFDAEISALDSISQVGEQIYVPRRYSDEAMETPQAHTSKQKQHILNDLNSSSPKSTTSGLSSFSMRTVEEVENSRVCRWILAFCVLLNVVLVLLLVMEVKDMRDSESWKARNSL